MEEKKTKRKKMAASSTSFYLCCYFVFAFYFPVPRSPFLSLSDSLLTAVHFISFHFRWFLACLGFSPPLDLFDVVDKNLRDLSAFLLDPGLHVFYGLCSLCVQPLQSSSRVGASLRQHLLILLLERLLILVHLAVSLGLGLTQQLRLLCFVCDRWDTRGKEWRPEERRVSELFKAGKAK